MGKEIFRRRVELREVINALPVPKVVTMDVVAGDGRRLFALAMRHWLEQQLKQWTQKNLKQLGQPVPSGEISVVRSGTYLQATFIWPLGGRAFWQRHPSTCIRSRCRWCCGAGCAGNGIEVRVSFIETMLAVAAREPFDSGRATGFRICTRFAQNASFACKSLPLLAFIFRCGIDMS